MTAKNSIFFGRIWFEGLFLALLVLVLSGFSPLKNGMAVMEEPVLVSDSLNYIPSIYPVDSAFAIIRSGFGMRWNPFSKKRAFHQGIDLAVPSGYKVYTSAKGVVEEASFDAKMGNYILIRHNGDFATFYAHLKTKLVKVGDEVQKGQVLGLVGSTGFATGPHLHYEVHKNGNPVDPTMYLPR